MDDAEMLASQFELHRPRLRCRDTSTVTEGKIIEIGSIADPSRLQKIAAGIAAE